MLVELKKIVTTWNSLGEHSLPEQLVVQRLSEMVFSLVQTVERLSNAPQEAPPQADDPATHVSLANFGPDGAAPWVSTGAQMPPSVLTSTDGAIGAPIAELKYQIEELTDKLPTVLRPLGTAPPEERLLPRISYPLSAAQTDTTPQGGRDPDVSREKKNVASPMLKISEEIGRLCRALMMAKITTSFCYTPDQLISLIGGFTNVSAIANTHSTALLAPRTIGEDSIEPTEALRALCKRIVSATAPDVFGFGRDEMMDLLGGMSVVSRAAGSGRPSA